MSQFDWKSFYGHVEITTETLQRMGEPTQESRVAEAFKYEPRKITREELESAITLPPGAVIHFREDGSGEIIFPGHPTQEGRE